MNDSEKLPPHNLETEQAVLGSLLIDRDAIALVADRLKPEAFYFAPNATIYRAMLALWNVRRPCDFVILTDLLGSRGKLDEVGGVAYISSLLSVTPTSVHVEHYANSVNEYARRRALIDAGAEMVRVGYADGPEPDYDGVWASSRARIVEHDPGDKPLDTRVDALVEELRETAFRRWDGEVDDRILTGVNDVDRMTGGMGKRELWIVAARPSMGKSALMIHMARRSRALIFSLEMPRTQILNRMVSAEAGVPYAVATSVVGDMSQREKWLAASERVAQMPMMIVDSPGMTTAKVQAISARAIAEQGINAVYIDHLNYLSDSFRSSNEQEKTGELVRRCKHLADALDVPVMLLSQLNRESENRNGCMPYLSDLRSSGRIEEDAHFVGLLYRRHYYSERGMIEVKPDLDWVPQTDWQQVQLIVAKNRNGETGTAFLGWEAKAMRFHETSERNAA